MASPVKRNRYDVVIAGARCAGASTAMLLARRGLHVLVVDPAKRGSDTLSTHAMMRGAVLQLHRWGLLDAIRSSGTSAIRSTTFHYGDERDNAAATAARVAERLGIEASVICIEPPKLSQPSTGTGEKGRPVIGGGAVFRGRAADKLTDGLPRRQWRELCECPYEELESPSRVHVDAYGHVHICQGISMGNMWETPLPELVRDYDPQDHPVCGPLIRGGPAALARALGVAPEEGYVDECHLCYTVRRVALDRFPDYLAPRQVYGPE